MRGSMRRVAFVSLAAMGVLAVWLTAQQVTAGSRYGDDPRNLRAQPVDDRRGPIVTADGVVVAIDGADGRSYPEGEVYLHAVGYVSPGGSAGVERTRAADLGTLDDGSITSWLLGLFGASLEPPELRLTLVDRVQQAAWDALDGETGAVVAIDPATGAVLAYVSSPSTDPNGPAGGSVTREEFAGDPASLDRAAFGLLPPGSTFKILVAAAALREGATPDTRYEDAGEYLAPGAGSPIGNAGGGDCGDGDRITLRQALVVSCNTVFAELAVDLGGDAVAASAEAAGLNTPLPFELGAALSSIPPGDAFDADAGALAQTGIGERDVRVTPLQMAVIAAGIGNRGVMMQPYLVGEVRTADGTRLSSATATPWGRVADEGVAAHLVSMMVDVVEEGTGRAARLAGVDVAGKTGTAEGGGGPHAWFIGFAPAGAPTIAVAVVVEGGGSGGRVAAPIAAAVLEAWFEG